MQRCRRAQRSAHTGDSFETRPAVFKYPNGQPFKEPVWIDLFTGRVYAFPKEKQIVVPAGVVFVDVPVYDSPCVLTDRSTVEVQCGYQTSQNDEGGTLDVPGDAQHAVVACVRGDRETLLQDIQLF